MPVEPEVLALAGDFPSPTRDEWRSLVSAVLGKSGVPTDTDPEDALTYTTYDGIRIRPLYIAADAPDARAGGLPGAPPFLRGASPASLRAIGWDSRARHADPDAERTNKALLDDLERGASSSWLVLGPGAIAVADLPTVLDGVYLDLAPIVLDAGPDTEAAADELLAVAQRRGVDPAELTGSFGADPIGTRARTGAVADLDMLTRLAQQRNRAVKLRLATVDGGSYHDAGASDAQELGIATAVGVAYLRVMTDSGLSIDDALDALEFRCAVTAEQFPSIAKLRAARRIWDRVAQLCGGSAGRRGQRQHAVTSAAMMTQRDPWVNMLRTTIACFAAAIGGAEAITVRPFDAAIGLPDDFARRIARNTQSVLHDEAGLARVVDAAGGSWFVESLTDELALAAWDVFTTVERAGGALAALDDGTIATMTDTTRAARAADINHRRAPITGVSEFAFVGEAPVHRRPAPATHAHGLVPQLRYAQEFEALRDRADAAGRRPRVFLAALGPLGASSARTAFAANLFQAAGLDCVTGSGTLDEIVAAFRASGTSVACLCSADRVYAEQAQPAAAALRAVGAARIWLAGTTVIDGVDGHVFTGCDALEVLQDTLDDLLSDEVAR